VVEITTFARNNPAFSAWSLALRQGHEPLTRAFCLAINRCINLAPSYL
jgi:hypothetical protein